MDHFIQLLISWLTGVVSGFLASVPVGPVNVTIVNDGARHGFLRAWLIGLGASTMEMIFSGMSLAGSASLFDSKLTRSTMELASFLMLTLLGFKYLRASAIETSSRSEIAIEEKLHPHTSFMIGFVRVLGNPGVLLLWITLSATFISHEWVDNNWMSKLACMAGVGMGTAAWFTVLSYGVSRRHGRFSPGTLLKLSHFSGGFLLLGALIVAIRLIRLLSNH